MFLIMSILGLVAGGTTFATFLVVLVLAHCVHMLLKSLFGLIKKFWDAFSCYKSAACDW